MATHMRHSIIYLGNVIPSVGVKPTHAFQACALNRSATSPILQEKNSHYLSPSLVSTKKGI